MLVRVYRAASGLEFRVFRDDSRNGLMICTCKEFRSGMRLRWNLKANETAHVCRHIRQYEQELASWNPDPLASLEWL
jgi:hypothetical protein